MKNCPNSLATATLAVLFAFCHAALWAEGTLTATSPTPHTGATAATPVNQTGTEGENPSEAPFTGWKQSSTRHFRFIYEDSFRETAEAYARVADEAWNRVSAAYDAPPDLNDVIVTGRTDFMGAWTEGLTPSMWYFSNAPLTPDFGYRVDWPTLVFTHELTHVANMEFNRRNSSKPGVFGPAIDQLRLYSIPGWEFEGLATVLETELTPGGRGRSPLFELQFKAPALDDSFIPYGEIGKEKRPPQGQNYVAGYLLMRSVADRFGLPALANIERSRQQGRSFDEAFRAVTGQSPETLWQDVRRALVKRYAGERAIPEGIIVTPRETGTSWFRPAIVTDDRIIALRQEKGGSVAAASLDPSTGRERVLFYGEFADERSLTADEKGTVVAAIQTRYGDALPGYRVATDLWKWTEKTGLVRLTSGASLFHPALSRSGNRLVALEAKGLGYRIVEVDLETGERKPLIESDALSFVQPALSPDGATLAFLALDGTRAVLETAPMPRYDFAYPVPQATIAKVANAHGPIVDLSDPSWTAEGKLLCASNARGRLEVWQWEGTLGKPMVADPAGAYWADRRPNGVIYASFAGSGFVLKMKPANDWGRIPDFQGPSVPGVPVSLAADLSDYDDFSPWPMQETGSTDAEPLQRTETAPKDDPIAALPEGIAFWNLPRLGLWLPLADAISLPDGETAFGAGAVAILSGYPLQQGARGNFIIAGGTLFPTLSQANMVIGAAFPLHTGVLYAIGTHDYGRDQVFSDGLFRENASLSLSWSIPARVVATGKNFIDGALVAGFEAKALRSSEEHFTMADDGPEYSVGYTGMVGLDIAERRWNPVPGGQVIEGDGNLDLYTSYFPIDGQSRLSGAFGFRFASGAGDWLGELACRGGWFDLPADVPFPTTLAKPRGFVADARFPGRAIFSPGLSYSGNAGLSARFYLEKAAYFGVNGAGVDTPDTGAPLNAWAEPWYAAGLEGGFTEGRARLSAGLVTRFRFGEAWLPLEQSRLYVEFKIDALRGILP